MIGELWGTLGNFGELWGTSMICRPLEYDIYKAPLTSPHGLFYTLLLTRINDARCARSPVLQYHRSEEGLSYILIIRVGVMREFYIIACDLRRKHSRIAYFNSIVIDGYTVGKVKLLPLPMA